MATKIATRSGLVLLSLVSRQIWPHILAVAHLRPSRLILLHSDEVNESRRPAERLRKFFNQRSRLIDRGATELEMVPHDDFAAVEYRIDALVKRLNIDGNCALNFTGGNKLMATATFRWAVEHRVRSFYLERGNRLTWFEPSEDGLSTRSETVDGSVTNALDPVALLQCQLLASEVDREGEKLTLGPLGKGLSDNEFRKRLQSESVRGLRGLMETAGYGDREGKSGDRLELAAAAALLKLGVAEVRRSLRLKVKTPSGVSSRRPHAEIDLLFNWNGRLWIVDCKDRASEENLMAALRRELPAVRMTTNTRQLLDRIGDELEISQTKALKEDLIAAAEIGGLLGQVVCVRRSELPEEASAYAQRNRIEVVGKNELLDGFRRLLYPQTPPSPERLRALERQYGGGSTEPGIVSELP